ncbi:cytochrome P450 [Natronobiforma cellulositropha]|uniref:cytochrome P450 n=1 Tax=Natronobiforma cellulositropha TaxID=1679076 RepID=UPI0021D5FC27|nr:cytochrome P450 [Natronobiforma cellulositropha]
MSESIPTPERLPVIGNALAVGRDPFAFVERAAREYGPVFRVSIPGHSFVCYADATLAERVFVTERTRYGKDPRERDLLGELLGEGLLTARGETWQRGREQVQPAFYPGRVQAYGEEILEIAERTVAGWTDGERVDAYASSTDIALSSIAATMFGLERLDEARLLGEAVDAITARFEPSRVPVEVPLWVPTPANRRYRRAVESIDGIVERLLARKRSGDRGGDDDLCSTLLSAADDGTLEDDAVRDHLVTVLLAGHETTAVALTYTLALLALHPAEQARVRQEVREPETLTPTTPLALTDRVVREALRLYPPTYLLYRQTVETDTVAGYEIPTGTRVVLPQWAYHRDERTYDEPHAFRPDRWLEDGPERPEYAYMPFGGGERACIGRRFALLELRLVVATVLRAVSLEATAETAIEPTPALTARPAGPVPLRIRR